MARVQKQGYWYSENGWPMVDQGSCVWISIPGTDVTVQVAQGVPQVCLGAFVADVSAFVETVRDYDTACYTETNSVPSSNHNSGTAVDINWNDHPMGQSYTGWSPDEIREMRALLDFWDEIIFWAEDWDTPKDSMHFQMGYATWDTDRDAPGQWVVDWIKTHIRPDGFSTYRRGAMPAVDPAQVLSDVMGGRLPLERYRQLLPAYKDCLVACECTTVKRIAMNAAQLGHESGGLYYTEEIASGDAYDTRTDLGNTPEVDGDGRLYKGRSWIQITGKTNYTRLSAWAYGKGLVPTVTYFVDHPLELSSDRYAGLGAAWYWVVARPDINALSDAGDIVAVTQRINGGQNGIDDRRARYTRALAMGDKLLALLGVTEEDDMFTDEDRNLLRQISEIRRPSLSPLRHLNEGDVNTCAGFAWTADALTHAQFVAMAARYGHADSIQLLGEVAGSTDPARAEDAKLARAILTDIATNHPEALVGFSQES